MIINIIASLAILSACVVLPWALIHLKNDKFYISVEPVGGEYYFMIYKRGLFSDLFFERLNTKESALVRLSELEQRG